MSANATTVAQMVTEALNASAAGSISTTIEATNFTRSADAITEYVREGAMMIARAIISNPTHVHRNLFVGTAQTLTHAGELPDMAGEGDLIEIQKYSGALWSVGQRRNVQEIDSYRNDSANNPNATYIYDTVAHTDENSRISGYYATSMGRFYFTGYAARGYFPIVDRATVTTLIPDEYEGTWIALSISMAMKEGDNLLPIAQHYLSIGAADLNAITTMSVLPMMPTAEQAKHSRGNP